ncbi:diguanylate cyclase [Desulfuromonas sp.]|uniref:GGDEF domain-containing response regulator n=1 Tax=Desulfuromonas sp. TaxID=892 RepID=UPI0025BFA093|nr:diguanylate cyclase [Desulfuromonas sp.]
MEKPTILVVDDELFFRRLYADQLKDDGHHVETVASGADALDRLRLGGVDVVLADLVMPEVDGLDVLRQARALPSPPEVILATGHATVESAIQALKNGARDYLIKPFDPGELRHLVNLCLDKRRLETENSQLKDQVRLFERGPHIVSQLEIEKLLPVAVELLLQELGGGRGFAFLLNRSKVSRLMGTVGLKETQAMLLARTLRPFLKDLEGPHLLDGEDLDPTRHWPKAIDRLCIFPLRSQNSIKGALVLINAPGGAFPDPFPMKSIEFLAQQAALAFENAFRYDGARQLMYTDDLTGLYNYRYLEMALDQEIRRAKRYGVPFSLVFIDLDHFKNINDTHGHLVGSNTLREVAKLLRKSVRDVDLLFRYGGDEFTALLVGTDSQGALLVAERIRKTIEGHTFRAPNQVNYSLTATVGYATFPEDAKDKEAIIDLADRAMYFGKKVRNVTRGAREITE